MQDFLNRLDFLSVFRSHPHPVREATRRVLLGYFVSVLGMVVWIGSIIWLHMAWRILYAVTRVEHVDVGMTPQAISAFAHDFPRFVFIVLGIMALLLLRRWFVEKSARERLEDLDFLKNVAQVNIESRKELVKKRAAGTKRLVKSFVWMCFVASVGNVILVQFINWTVKAYIR